MCLPSAPAACTCRTWSPDCPPSASGTCRTEGKRKWTKSSNVKEIHPQPPLPPVTENISMGTFLYKKQNSNFFNAMQKKPKVGMTMPPPPSYENHMTKENNRLASSLRAGALLALLVRVVLALGLDGTRLPRLVLVLVPVHRLLSGVKGDINY